jgi:hypothetical protein
MSSFIPNLGWTGGRAARQRRQTPITADDVNDIETVAKTAMDTQTFAMFKPEVTVTHARGGVIVRAAHTYHLRPAQLLREALEQMGYVVSARDFASDAVTVTGRDPEHTWSEINGSQEESR